MKVLTPLVSAGVLRSLKGPNGGFRLARAASQITLLEVVEAVDGPLRAEAPRVAGVRDGLDPRLEGVCERVAEEVRRRFGQVRLSDLAGKTRPAGRSRPLLPATRRPRGGRRGQQGRCEE